MISLKSQREAIQKYCKEQGWVVVQDIISDTASGAILNRPGLHKLRKLMRDKALDTVIAYAVDRLSRNQNHVGILLDEAETHGVTLDFVTEKFESNPMGRMVLALRSFMAELEREKISERTGRGKIERAKAGKIPHGTNIGCYGYIYSKDTGVRTINEEQAVVVRWMFEQSASGKSTHYIANQLAERGVTSLSGKLWNPRTVLNILRNDVYTGRTYTGRREWIKVDGKRSRTMKTDPATWVEIIGASPRIVSDELFAAAAQRLDNPHFRPVSRKGRDFLVTGFLSCAFCSSPMSGHTVKGKYGPHHYYRCAGTLGAHYRPKICKAKELPAIPIEEHVWGDIKTILDNPDLILLQLASQDGVNESLTAEIKLKEKRLDRLDAEQVLIIRAYRDPNLDKAKIEQETALLKKQKEMLSKDVTELRLRQRGLKRSAENQAAAVEHVRAMRQALGSFDYEMKRLALAALDVKVVITPGEVPSIQVQTSLRTEKFTTIGQTSACSSHGSETVTLITGQASWITRKWLPA